MSEVVGVYLLLSGVAVLLLGLCWLILQSYRKHGWWMATLLLLTSPVGPMLFGLINFRRAKVPLILILLGLTIGAMPFAYSHGFELIFGLGERDRMVAGERFLTLTGWDRPNYSLLASRTDTVVLELGNADVNDETLELLLPMTQLKELTLSDSLVTDAAFTVFKKLPSLEKLRLQRTKISKKGLAEFLDAPPGMLKEIDVSGNSIPASALRKWKNQDSENRRYVN